jgi:hypothetical protein
MDDVLGARNEGLRPHANPAFPGLAATIPPAETMILRLRGTLPRYADEIIARARAYYQA